MSSQPPVSSAICGMSPSLFLPGRRRRGFDVGEVETVLELQSLSMSTAIVRRHLPI
jgi:hypothetical protein